MPGGTGQQTLNLHVRSQLTNHASTHIYLRIFMFPWKQRLPSYITQPIRHAGQRSNSLGWNLGRVTNNTIQVSLIMASGVHRTPDAYKVHWASLEII